MNFRCDIGHAAGGAVDSGKALRSRKFAVSITDGVAGIYNLT